MVNNIFSRHLKNIIETLFILLTFMFHLTYMLFKNEYVEKVFFIMKNMLLFLHENFPYQVIKHNFCTFFLIYHNFWACITRSMMQRLKIIKNINEKEKNNRSQYLFYFTLYFCYFNTHDNSATIWLSRLFFKMIKPIQWNYCIRKTTIVSSVKSDQSLKRCYVTIRRDLYAFFKRQYFSFLLLIYICCKKNTQIVVQHKRKNESIILYLFCLKILSKIKNLFYYKRKFLNINSVGKFTRNA